MARVLTTRINSMTHSELREIYREAQARAKAASCATTTYAIPNRFIVRGADVYAKNNNLHEFSSTELQDIEHRIRTSKFMAKKVLKKKGVSKTNPVQQFYSRKRIDALTDTDILHIYREAQICASHDKNADTSHDLIEGKYIRKGAQLHVTSSNTDPFRIAEYEYIKERIRDGKFLLKSKSQSSSLLQPATQAPPSQFQSTQTKKRKATRMYAQWKDGDTSDISESSEITIIMPNKDKLRITWDENEKELQITGIPHADLSKAVYCVGVSHNALKIGIQK